MAFIFKELAYCETPMGRLSLRFRTEPALNTEVYEIQLNDEFLMSSHFTEAEEQLARLGLAPLKGTEADVVVGGLGLGYTACTALAFPNVRSLTVIDALAEVIGWHQSHLLPLGETLTSDPRCRLLHGDFFALATQGHLDPAQPDRKFDAILLDVDHSPRSHLHPSHAWLYTQEGLARLAEQLHPGGLFALWSNDPPDDAFLRDLASVFPITYAEEVSFKNPLQNCLSFNTIYTARREIP
jgi:spermidine synthase